MSESIYLKDPWPVMPDGTDFDGSGLLSLLRNGKSPFAGAWDVNLLIQEIEKHLATRVVDIPTVIGGQSNYGLHLTMSDGREVVARLANADLNMPGYGAYRYEMVLAAAGFEAAVYTLLVSEPKILASSLLYYRFPVQNDGPKVQLPQDLSGRTLFLFERSKGELRDWAELSPNQKDCFIFQAARIRAALFDFNPSIDFCSAWYLKCLDDHKPASFAIPVAPTREFCISVFTSKIEATIKDIGDMIGWEGDNVTVGPVAFAAKQSLLSLIPYILPADDKDGHLYRLVLEHGDFGYHNMTTTFKDTLDGQPLVTSVYDWEFGSIAPTILSQPAMKIRMDFDLDEDVNPIVSGMIDNATQEDVDLNLSWAKQYYEFLFNESPSYERAIRAGKDARHLWFALKEWRGEDPEGYFGRLGTWAEKRLKELKGI